MIKLLLLLLLSPLPLFAAPPPHNVVFHCYMPLDISRETVVTAIIKPAAKKGNSPSVRGLIKVANTEYLTDYNLDGFNMRWDFGASKSADNKKFWFNYTFIIKPNKFGYYYDFNNRKAGKASLIVKCHNASRKTK